MSYCVNCGVKLAPSEKECPLCHTKVINPNIEKPDFHPVYPDRIDIRKKVNIKYLMSIFVLSFLIVAVICLTTDLLISKGKLTWSIYCVVSLIYLSGLLQYIIQKNIYISHVINLLGMEFFILIFALVFKIVDIYLRILLPLTLVLWGYIFVITLLVRLKKINNLRKISFFLFYTVISLYVIELAINLVSYSSIMPTWSFIASIPITIVALVFFIISFSKKVIDAINQKLFI